MNIREQSPTYDQVVGNIERAVEQLTTTGFVEFFLPEYDRALGSSRPYWKAVDKQWPIGTIFIRKVIKRIARELKRPYVIADSRPWYEGVTIVMKKRIYLAPLVANFMLMDDDGYGTKKGPGVWFKQDTANYYIGFGKRADYIEWRDWVLSTPECRKALKLPPLPDEVIPLAA